MNILDHIRAGNYPLDDKGRALVPVESAINPAKPWIATICATDGPYGAIIGFGTGSTCEWAADGTPVRNNQGRLLPPARPEPQIVERFGYAYPCGPATYGVYAHQLLTSREAADEARRQIKGPTYLAKIMIEMPT